MDNGLLVWTKNRPYRQHVDYIATLGEGKDRVFCLARSDMFYCCDINGRMFLRNYSDTLNMYSQADLDCTVHGVFF